jgi:EAL domain-containing protein (putative c-di-GMP-specific phosphodiesterase class I)
LAFERVLLESHLRKAIEENEFIAYYQPKVNSQNGRIIGVEALIRWQNPLLGLISPLQFIPLAEDIGFIGQIDRWMMKEAMNTVKGFHKTGLFEGSLSLNVSMKQLEDTTFVQYLLDTIQEVEFDTQKLEMEVTESQIMKNPESAIKTLNKIREIGIKISVDDFGTGHSSLSYLKKLPIDILKIDRSFVKDAHIDEDDAAIVKMIIALAKSLKLKFIAEGVEVQEQLDFLKSVDCHDIQGYFYSKPLPEDEFKRFLLIHSKD